MDDNRIKLKQVGFFEALEHGNYDGGSLKACKRNQVADGEEKLVEYLKNGAVVCVTPGIVYDVIDKSKGIIGNLEILTDGDWMWPSDLEYYVREYHVELCEDFLKHVRNSKFTLMRKE